MDIVINLLIAAHILAVVVGGSNSVLGPVVSARLPSATPEQRLAYFGVMNAASQVGKVAMVVLLLSGPTVLFLKYGGLSGANIWFWIKMALVVVMLAGIIAGGINFKKLQAGDVKAGERAEVAHKITGAAALGVVIAAVFAFN